jgi:hypothetical protein
MRMAGQRIADPGQLHRFLEQVFRDRQVEFGRGL